MTAYTWNPTSLAQFVTWNTPGYWLPAVVPNATDADVIMPVITHDGAPYGFFVSIQPGESFVVNSLSIFGAGLTVYGALSVIGELTLDSEVNMAGSLSVGTLAMATDALIQGYGRVSSSNSITNQGMITGFGLTLDVQGLRNDGVLTATSGNLDIEISGGAGAFGNLSGGTLSGGRYAAVGGTLLIDIAAPITTDAASIALQGLGGQGQPTIATAAGDIQQTLRTIAAGGEFSLYQTGFNATNALLDAGRISLVQGTLETSLLTVANGGVLAGTGVVSAPIVLDGTVIAGEVSGYDGITLTLSGAVSGSGSLVIDSGNYLSPGIPSVVGKTLELGGAVSTGVRFSDASGALIIDQPAQFTGTISGFSTSSFYGWHGTPQYHGNAVVLAGLSTESIISSQYAGDATGGTLTLQTAASTIALSFAGSYVLSDFVLTTVPPILSNLPPSLMITESLPCYAAGTCIRTARGEVAVEQLAIGDAVCTPRNGGTEPVRWIGHRHIDTSRHRRPEQVWPVRVRAHAFGLGRPERDVRLSPDHAVHVDDVLIPIRLLANGVSIAQERVAEVTYYHVELPRHDVILADGLPAESYLDLGNRAAFANGGGAVALHPDCGAAIWQEKGCAELILGGPVLETVRRRLMVQARLAGLCGDPGLPRRAA